MSGLRSRLARLEQVQKQSWSLNGLAERMRRRQRIADIVHPHTREHYEAVVASAGIDSLAGRMAGRALRNLIEGN